MSTVSTSQPRLSWVEGRAELAAVVAHDLLDPLTTVTGFLRVLDGRHGPELSPGARELLQAALEGAAEMARRVEAILAQARLGSVVPRVATVDLPEALAAACARLAAAVAGSGAQVECEAGVTVPMDPELCGRLLEQLVSNGIKFARPGRRPRIRVSSRALGEACELRVSDAGVGVPPDMVDRVFEMFVRAAPGGRPGSGIGLAQCRAITEAHGGRIWIEPNETGGTTVVVFLPAGVLP